MSQSDVLSIIGNQGYWILPQATFDFFLSRPSDPTGTQSQINDTVSLCLPSAQRVFDAKSGLQICVLNVPKNPIALDQTEGILSHLSQQLEEQSIESEDLIKRAWKTSEQNDD